MYACMYHCIFIHVYSFYCLFIYAHTVPTTIPTGIRVVFRAKTSVIVKWNHLRAFDIEAIETFLITLKWPKSYALQNTYIYMQYDRLFHLQTEIQNLIPGTTYEMTITAINAEGSGPHSLPVMFTTKQ